jgi:hypothetical protein
MYKTTFFASAFACVASAVLGLIPHIGLGRVISRLRRKREFTAELSENIEIRETETKSSKHACPHCLAA